MSRPRNPMYDNRAVLKVIKRLWLEKRKPPTLNDVYLSVHAARTSTFQSIRELRVLGLLEDSSYLIPTDIIISFKKEDY